MSDIEIKRCDECGNERQVKPCVSGQLWPSQSWPYKLTYVGSFPGTFETADLCSDDCLSKSVAKLLKGKEDARR